MLSGGRYNPKLRPHAFKTPWILKRSKPYFALSRTECLSVSVPTHSTQDCLDMSKYLRCLEAMKWSRILSALTWLDPGVVSVAWIILKVSSHEIDRWPRCKWILKKQFACWPNMILALTSLVVNSADSWPWDCVLCFWMPPCSANLESGLASSHGWSLSTSESTASIGSAAVWKQKIVKKSRWIYSRLLGPEQSPLLTSKSGDWLCDVLCFLIYRCFLDTEFTFLYLDFLGILDKKISLPTASQHNFNLCCSSLTEKTEP